MKVHVSLLQHQTFRCFERTMNLYSNIVYNTGFSCALYFLNSLKNPDINVEEADVLNRLGFLVSSNFTTGFNKWRRVENCIITYLPIVREPIVLPSCYCRMAESSDLQCWIENTPLPGSGNKFKIRCSIFSQIVILSNYKPYRNFQFSLTQSKMSHGHRFKRD